MVSDGRGRGVLRLLDHPGRLMTAWLERSPHPALLLWFLIGLADWLLNLAVYHVLHAFGFRGVMADSAKKLGVDTNVLWGLTLAGAVALGPLAMLHTLYLSPGWVRTFRSRRAAKRTFNEKCTELEDDAIELVVELANCDHSSADMERPRPRCEICGAVYYVENGTWTPSVLGVTAKSIVQSADAAGITLVCECPEGTHDK